MRALIYSLFILSFLIAAGAATGHLQKRLDDRQRLQVIEYFNRAFSLVLAKEGKTISVSEALQRQNSGEFKIIFVDLRDPVARAVSRIPNSRPFAFFDINAVNFETERVIFYDLTGLQGLTAAMQFQTKARKGKVFGLEGGLLAWLHAGQPIVDETTRPTNRVHVTNALFSFAPKAFIQVW